MNERERVELRLAMRRQAILFAAIVVAGGLLTTFVAVELNQLPASIGAVLFIPLAILPAVFGVYGLLAQWLLGTTPDGKSEKTFVAVVGAVSRKIPIVGLGLIALMLPMLLAPRGRPWRAAATGTGVIAVGMLATLAFYLHF